MKIVNSEELIEILKATTAEEITLTTSTEVKMNKRGNSLVENGNKVTKTASATYSSEVPMRSESTNPLIHLLVTRQSRFLGVLG